MKTTASNGEGYPGDKQKKCQRCDLPKAACGCAFDAAYDASIRQQGEER